MFSEQLQKKRLQISSKSLVHPSSNSSSSIPIPNYSTPLPPTIIQFHPFHDNSMTSQNSNTINHRYCFHCDHKKLTTTITTTTIATTTTRTTLKRHAFVCQPNNE